MFKVIAEYRVAARQMEDVALKLYEMFGEMNAFAKDKHLQMTSTNLDRLQEEVTPEVADDMNKKGYLIVSMPKFVSGCQTMQQSPHIVLHRDQYEFIFDDFDEADVLANLILSKFPKKFAVLEISKSFMTEVWFD